MSLAHRGSMSDVQIRGKRATPARKSAESTRTKYPAIYVHVEPDRKDRYERAAAELGLSMREYVLQALDTFGAQQMLSLVGTADTSPEGEAETRAWLLRRLNQHSLRLEALEKQIEALRAVVDGMAP